MNFLTADVAIAVDASKIPAQLARAKRAVVKSCTSMKKSFTKMGTRFTNVFKKMASTAKRYAKYIVASVLLIGAACIKFAMDAQESENLFEVSMGNMADAARKWSEELSEALYLNAFEVRKNISTFNVMFDSMGMGEKAAYAMAKGLTQLSYDMASFYNLKPAEAFLKLQAGITGETEPLKRLGILINETTVKQFALNTGLWDGVGAMTELEKVTARYQLILSQTGKAQGDMARTLDSSTNVFRSLGSLIKETAISIGEKLLPAITAVGVAMRDWLAGNQEKVVAGVIKGIQSMVRAVHYLTGLTRKMPLYWLELQIQVEKTAVIFLRVADVLANIAIIPSLIRGASDWKLLIAGFKADISELELKTHSLAETYVTGAPKVDAFFDSIVKGMDKAQETSEKTTKTIKEQYIDVIRAKIAMLDELLAKNAEVSAFAQKLAEEDKLVVIQAAQDQIDFVRAQDYMTRTMRIQNLEDWVTENQLSMDKVAEANKILTDELSKLERGKWEGLRRWQRNASDVYLNINKIAVRAFDGMADALTDMVMRGKADFKALALSIIADIMRMIIKMQIARALGIVMGGFGGGGGSLTDFGATAPSGLSYIPSAQHGALVTQTGIAKIHKGEVISGVNNEMGFGGITVNNYVSDTVDVEIMDEARVINITKVASIEMAAHDGAYRQAHRIKR